MKIENNGTNLKLENSNLNLSTVFENYNYLGHNKGGEIRATIFDNNGTADVKDDDIMQFTVTDARTRYIRMNIVDKSKGNFMLVEKNNVLPKTAAPSIGDYEEFFAKELQNCDELIHFNIYLRRKCSTVIDPFFI